MFSVTDSQIHAGDSGRFRFVRWFTVVCLLAVGSISLLSSVVISGFLTESLLERDATVSMEYLNSVVHMQGASRYFRADAGPDTLGELNSFLQHVARMPDVLRANVYADDRSRIWTSDPSLENHHFGSNPELELAFAGVVAPELESLDDEEFKDEHAFLSVPGGVFVENYLPIRAENGGEVIGVVEVYRAPSALMTEIAQGRRLVWLTSAGAGLALFVGLLGFARYADGLLHRQHRRMLELERLAVIGEMASAVAHGLRNPLASIRSSAELVLEDEFRDESRRPLQGIIDQADRLEQWIRNFLESAVPRQGGTTEMVKLHAMVGDCVHGFEFQLREAKVDVRVNVADDLPEVQTEPAGLREAINAIIANSIEAMNSGGELTIEATADRPAGRVRLVFADTGPGLGEETLARLFEPYATTKTGGLGVGLPLARRMLERWGGTLDLDNRDSGGARVTMVLRTRGSRA